MNKTLRPSGKFCYSFLLLVLLFGCFSAVSGQSKYVKKYSGLADSLSEVYGIPPAVMLGIAIIESSSGTSRNCRLLNNHFGIIGKNNLLRTKGIKTKYKQYPDDTSSYVDFCRLMTKKKFYSKLKGNMDYKLWIDAISKAKYSEVPAVWKQRILQTIRKNRLYAISKNQ